MNVEKQVDEILNALPSAILEKIAKQVEMEEEARWGSGRLAIELLDELGDRYAKSAIRLAVSQLYYVTEATIRERERIARAVSDDLRQAHPLLTFHYWRAAVNAGDKMMDIVSEIEAYHEAWGKMPTVAQVFGWLKEDGKARPVWLERLHGIRSQAEKVLFDTLAPDDVVVLLQDLLERVLKILDKYDKEAK